MKQAAAKRQPMFDRNSTVACHSVFTAANLDDMNNTRVDSAHGIHRRRRNGYLSPASHLSSTQLTPRAFNPLYAREWIAALQMKL